jgi:hypothetical protein
VVVVIPGGKGLSRLSVTKARCSDATNSSLVATQRSGQEWVTIPANRVTIPAQYVNQTTTPVPLPLPIPNQALELLFLFLSQTLRLYPRRLLQLEMALNHKKVHPMQHCVWGLAPYFHFHFCKILLDSWDSRE